MIGKVSGRIDYRGNDHVLIDVRGVGYIVYVSDRTMAGLPPVGEAAALFTDLQVREDLLQLFGFVTLIEKEWHRLLMTVQGIGAKASMAILGALGAEGVARAIALGDVKAIQMAPGVGPKIAQRVVLELKSKAPALMAMAGARGASVAAAPGADDVIEAERVVVKPGRVLPAKPGSNAVAEALSALINLGYTQGDAAGAVAEVAGIDPDASTSTLIRAALKLLAPKA